jgi:hypothetical protein
VEVWRSTFELILIQRVVVNATSVLMGRGCGLAQIYLSCRQYGSAIEKKAQAMRIAAAGTRRAHTVKRRQLSRIIRFSCEWRAPLEVICDINFFVL